MSSPVLVFLAACLANNLVLHGLIGVCPAASLSRRMDAAAAIAVAVLIVSALAAPVAWLLHEFVLVPLGLLHLQTVTFVLCLAAIVFLGAAMLERWHPRHTARIRALVPVMLVNCTALGVALLAVERAHGLIASVFFGLGAGAGFALVVIMLAALRERIDTSDVPRPFRGLPALLLTLGMLSMAFVGFTGMGAR